MGMLAPMRQLFDAESGTYTYLLWDPKTLEAVLIDSVREKATRDLQLIKDLDLKLKLVLETHVHADHITAAFGIQEKTGAKIALSRHAGAKGADLELKEGDKIR